VGQPTRSDTVSASTSGSARRRDAPGEARPRSAGLASRRGDEARAGEVSEFMHARVRSTASRRRGRAPAVLFAGSFSPPLAASLAASRLAPTHRSAAAAEVVDYEAPELRWPRDTLGELARARRCVGRLAEREPLRGDRRPSCAARRSHESPARTPAIVRRAGAASRADAGPRSRHAAAQALARSAVSPIQRRAMPPSAALCLRSGRACRPAASASRRHRRRSQHRDAAVPPSLITIP